MPCKVGSDDTWKGEGKAPSIPTSFHTDRSSATVVQKYVKIGLCIFTYFHLPMSV